MKLATPITIIVLALGGASLAGCVAQVGQGEERTGTARSSLDPSNGGDPGTPDPGQGDPGNTVGSTDNPTSGDNQGPQPLPWMYNGATASPQHK